MTWKQTPLSEICSPKQHKTISGAELTSEGYPAFGANGQIGFYSTYTHAEETIAITCRGATCGTINVAPAFSYISGNAMALDSLDHKRVDLRFLVHALCHRGLSDVISGSAQPQITRAPLLDLQILLPTTLEEQKRIATILDQADELRCQRQRALDRLSQLSQAIFYDMFGDPISNSKNWRTSQLNDVCENITDGTHDTPERTASGIPFITSKNIRPFEFDLSNIEYVSRETHAEIIKRCNPKLGDILYTNIGASVGNAVKNTLDFEFSLKNVALIQPNKLALLPEYLEFMFNNEVFRAALLAASAAGGAQKFITLKALRGVTISVPPLAIQMQFAKLIDAISNNKRQMQNDFRGMKKLGASLQHRAFRGEL